MKLLKLATATMLALGVSQAYTDQTNLVQNLSIQLSGVKQGRTSNQGPFINRSVNFVRVDTRGVIRALGTATGNNFSFASRLVLLTSDGNAPVFQVRDGGNTVDVSRYFTYEQTTDSVTSTQHSLRTGRTLEVNYSIQRLALHDGSGSVSMHFDVSGFTTQSNANGQPGDDTFINGSGSGDQDGDLMILRGVVGILGHTVEIVPAGNGGGIS